MQLRQIAPVALVLALTVAGFIGARLLGERDARRDSEHRAEVAAAQIRGRVEQGASLAESLRRFMAGVAGDGASRGPPSARVSGGFRAAVPGTASPDKSFKPTAPGGSARRASRPPGGSSRFRQPSVVPTSGGSDTQS